MAARSSSTLQKPFRSSSTSPRPSVTNHNSITNHNSGHSNYSNYSNHSHLSNGASPKPPSASRRSKEDWGTEVASSLDSAEALSDLLRQAFVKVRTALAGAGALKSAARPDELPLPHSGLEAAGYVFSSPPGSPMLSHCMSKSSTFGHEAKLQQLRGSNSLQSPPSDMMNNRSQQSRLSPLMTPVESTATVRFDLPIDAMEPSIGSDDEIEAELLRSQGFTAHLDDDFASPDRSISFSPRESRESWRVVSKDSTWSPATDTGIELYPIWVCEDEEKPPILRSAATTFFTEEPQSRAGDQLAGSCFLQGLVRSPTSRVRLGWDMLSSAVIMYDLLTLPLTVFGYDELTVAIYIGLFTSLFWFFDIIFSFFVGFHRDDGIIEMRMGKIAWRYIKSWFCLDIIIVTVDIMMFTLNVQAYEAVGIIRAGKSLRMVRIARVLRVVKLFRVARLVNTLDDLMDVVFSRALLTFVSIVRLMVGVAVCAHFVACAWYAMGTWSESDGETSWLDTLTTNHASVAYRYVCSYHWVMAQFTPAPVEFHPSNVRERTFSLLVLFIGFVLFSSLVGSTSALINQSRQDAYSRLKEASSLRRFYVDNHISVALGARITNFLKSSGRTYSRVLERDLPTLKALPVSLQKEMHFEVHSQFISVLPIFQKLLISDHDSMVDFCHFTMREAAVQKHEEPLHHGIRSPGMLFLCFGKFEYHRQSDRKTPEVVDLGTPFCEVALWTEWECTGILVAREQASVLWVYSEAFRSTAKKHPLALRILRSYAQEFGRRLQELALLGDRVDDRLSLFESLLDLERSMRSMSSMRLSMMMNMENQNRHTRLLEFDTLEMLPEAS